MSGKNKYQNRRDFVKSVGKLAVALPIGYLAWELVPKTTAGEFVWQIDPYSCTQCGQCETNCVQTVSAVKCMHAYEMCGYCDLCSGYLRMGVKELNTGAELQLCPTSAITRSFVENPYFEYTIDENLCNGCGKCVKGCADFGNGSLYLQIIHELCVNCNQCSIAQSCPADAIQRIPATKPYILKEGYKTDES
ncbi:MAG: ferredoxin [Bacteroidetes bacterium]|nr:ferredoxin [Bacteroidota bacterium]MBL6943944.1 ferredoxin [Bacteroidales bacterium]